MILIFTLIGLLAGSLMFSYWIGLLLKINIRSVGDGNPGASNLWASAGFQFGLLGVALDFFKGYLPVLLIVSSGVVSGYEVIPIALAPTVGHAFSPFLKFNGGKSLAVTFGVWSALTNFRASLTLAIILAFLYLAIRLFKRGKRATSNEDGLQTILGFLLLSIYLVISNYPGSFTWIWIGNFIILLWKNKSGLIQLLKGKPQKDEKHSAV